MLKHRRRWVTSVFTSVAVCYVVDRNSKYLQMLLLLVVVIRYVSEPCIAADIVDVVYFYFLVERSSRLLKSKKMTVLNF